MQLFPDWEGFLHLHSGLLLSTLHGFQRGKLYCLHPYTWLNPWPNFWGHTQMHLCLWSWLAFPKGDYLRNLEKKPSFSLTFHWKQLIVFLATFFIQFDFFHTPLHYFLFSFRELPSLLFLVLPIKKAWTTGDITIPRQQVRKWVTWFQGGGRGREVVMFSWI